MEIVHNKESKQFILPLSNGLEAKVDYIIDDNGTMRLIHSEVPYEMRGKRIGEKLVVGTFEKLIEEGYEAVAVCSYIRAIVKRHSKWGAIIKL